MFYVVNYTQTEASMKESLRLCQMSENIAATYIEFQSSLSSFCTYLGAQDKNE